MTGSRTRAWVALGLILHVHPNLRRRLVPGLVDPEAALAATPGRMASGLKLRPMEAGAIFSGNFPEWADKEIRAAGKAGVTITTFEEADYPRRLRNLPDPPAYVCARGDLVPADDRAVAVVGSRRATPYGLRVAEELSRGLACRGLTIVSGMARGVDSAAHRGALAAGGRTIAVLGSGIDVCYPKENAKLFGLIPGQGALISEMPFGTGPLPRHFPVRNRIIAGLGATVVVVEAARDSGSLITARLAAEAMGLQVCAVPGPITAKNSEGCNDLIYDGATPVRSAADVIAELPLGMQGGLAMATATVPPDVAGLAEEARRVLDALATEVPKRADDLAIQARLASGVLLGHLLELEVRGLAERLPGGLYVRKA